MIAMKQTPLFLIAFFLISLVILFNNDFFAIRFISGSIQRASSSLLSLLYATKISNSPKDSQEIKKLKDEINLLQKKLADFNLIKKDNEALKNQFNTQEIKSSKLLPSKIVGFSGTLERPYIFIIDKGKNEGVKKGMTVVYGNNLVGKIQSSSEEISEVELLTNKNFSTLGKITSTNAIGIIKGEEDFVLFDKVPITENIESDELVATKGELNKDGIGITSDIIVGKISSINKKENRPFQNAKIVPLVNFSRMVMVFVILP